MKTKLKTKLLIIRIMAQKLVMTVLRMFGYS